MRYLLSVLALLMTAQSADAQTAGQVGASVKAQLAPQVALNWHVTDVLLLRGSGYFEGGGEEVVDFDRFIGSAALLFQFSVDEDLSTYVGPDVTRNNFASETFLGAIVGSRYQLHDRFAAFGEFGVSIDVGDRVDSVNMFNTGVGILFYLNR